MTERFCDCPRCPCNVPVEPGGGRGRSATHGGGKDCAECKRGNHMDWRTAKRAQPEAQ
jgi:hypothetical protein